MCEVAVDPSIFGCHTSRMPRLLLHKSIRFITIHRALKFIHRKNSWNLKKIHLFEKHFKPLFKISIFFGGEFHGTFCRDPWQADDATKVLKTIEARFKLLGMNINVGGFYWTGTTCTEWGKHGEKRAISLFLLLFLFCLEWILQQNLMICAVHYMVANWLLGIPVSVREFDGIGFFAPGIGSEIKFPMFPYVS